MLDQLSAQMIIIFLCLGGAVFALYCAAMTKKTYLPTPKGTLVEYMNRKRQAEADEDEKEINDDVGDDVALLGMKDEDLELISLITKLIRDGAHSFLYREYFYIGIFMLAFFGIIVVFVGVGDSNWPKGLLTGVAFIFGAATSVFSGLLGMKIAVYTNGRTACATTSGMKRAFIVAFRGGAVMGFSLVSLAVFVLFIVITLFRLYYQEAFTNKEVTMTMFEAVAGYGLGGSSIALFGRVGGGIYTKAADVGADLVSKLENDIPEDDPSNPATIADNVGDNVGDIAGMGADLFGSFAESACAAMVIASQGSLYKSYTGMLLPLLVAVSGIFSSFVVVVGALAFEKIPNTVEHSVEPILRRQLIFSTILQTPLLYLICVLALPSSFTVSSIDNVTPLHIFGCLCCGLWAGLVIGVVTYYYTSSNYSPVDGVVNSSFSGAATNIIQGLALGYKSTIVPIVCLIVTVFVAYHVAGMFGVACGALGILSTLCVGLTIDAYGPISDNAGGIVEMSEIGDEYREITDSLDAAGNTTAAIGKGFAIGSAALVSFALFGGYVTICEIETVDVLSPYCFGGLLFGAMLPFWFSALTMEAVGSAASDMVDEVRDQFKDNDIKAKKKSPDYDRCVQIATNNSLKFMIAPGLLVMLSPILMGLLFGRVSLAGMLIGALTSGVQLAISASNSGGAWDNAKKKMKSNLAKARVEVVENDTVEKRDQRIAAAEAAYKASITGDTVGDPMKDTSGPSLNILIKLMAIISLVFAPAFPETGYLISLFV